MSLLAPPLRMPAGDARSLYGTAGGWIIYIPLTSGQIRGLPEKSVAARICRAVRMAERMGAGVIGLDDFTPVAGNAGFIPDSGKIIAATNGGSYNLAAALEGAGRAALLMGHKLSSARVVVLGSAGPAGGVCALMLARETRKMTLVGREKRVLEDLAGRIYFDSGLSVGITSDLKEALRRADIVIAAGTAASGASPGDLPPGSVVYDLARPPGISRQVALERGDVLAVEGALVEVPGSGVKVYPGLAETMILAMEGCRRNFSPGRPPGVEQVEEMAALARKHGFRFAGFKSLNRVLTPQDIDQIRGSALGKGLRAV